MPSSHLILSHPLLLLPPIPPSIKVFPKESTLRMRWLKYWSFSFSIIPSKAIPGLISFRMDWLDLLAYLTYMQSTSWETLDWKKQAGIKIAGRNINILNICRWLHPYGRKWRGTKKSLDENKKEEWKRWLKAQHSENEDHGIRSCHYMGKRWRNSGNRVRLYFGGAPKSQQMVIAAMKLKDACSLEGKLWST